MARLPLLSSSNTGLEGRSPPRTLRKVRQGSPWGGSIFTTSAPQSARMPPAPGPATQTPSSTTRTPSRGPLMNRERRKSARAGTRERSRKWADRIPGKGRRPARRGLVSLGRPAGDRLTKVGGLDHAGRLRFWPRRAHRDVMAHRSFPQSTDRAVVTPTEDREGVVGEVPHGVRVRHAVDVVVAD